MKTAVFIPVRTASTRLPNKALLEVNGKPIIEYLIGG
jgi:CMP-2-keto-3-deoxyoctulosonic acid synthetase